MARRNKGVGDARVVEWYGAQFFAGIDKGTYAGLQTSGKLLADAVKASLGGPAGSPEGGPPGKVSGGLQRAIGYKIRRSDDGFGWTARVGVVKGDWQTFAQAVRLSAGYVGRDKLGRIYSQGPRPFLAPVMVAKGAAAFETFRRVVKAKARI